MRWLLLLLTGAVSACSGETAVDQRADSGNPNDAGGAADANGSADALACVPGEHDECELGRPCPGIAACLADGTGFGACGCVSCKLALEAGLCAWQLSTLDAGALNLSFLSVTLTKDGVSDDVFPVASASACSAGGGWFIAGSETLELCPTTCDAVKGGAEPMLTLGCAS